VDFETNIIPQDRRDFPNSNPFDEEVSVDIKLI